MLNEISQIIWFHSYVKSKTHTHTQTNKKQTNKLRNKNKLRNRDQMDGRQRKGEWEELDEKGEKEECS